MKKWLLIACLLLPLGVEANDLYVRYDDVMVSADTDGVRVDSVLTPETNVRDYRRIWFSLELDGQRTDTAFANDSYFVFIQESANRVDWTTHTFTTDSLIKIKKGANDTIVTGSESLNRDSTYGGNWLRGLIIHRNELSEVDINGNTYTKDVRLWIHTVD